MGKKTKTKSSPWKPAQPYIKSALATTQNVVGANQPYLDELAGNIRANVPTIGQMAFGPNPMLDAAKGYASNVLGGSYLNSNPYLDSMIGQTANDVQDRINAQFANAGMEMSTPYVGAMTRELTNAENAMRFNNYSAERGYQNQAAGMAPELTSAQYAGVMPYLAAAQGAGELPYAGVSALTPIIGLANGSGTTTQKKGFLQSLMDAGTAAAMAYAQSGSDPAMKTNIVKVGEEPDGLGVYEWDYRDDLGFDLPRGRFRGVMADEVKALRPAAYIPDFIGGYSGVDYSRL